MNPALQARPSTVEVERVDSSRLENGEAGAVPVVERELQQVLALIALAEREQQLERTSRFRTVVAFFLLASGCAASFMLIALGWWFVNRESWFDGVVFLVLGGTLALLIGAALGKRFLDFKNEAKKHRRASTEVGETIREVVTTTDWTTRLEPLEWAHLRIRITQLELFDLTSLK